MRNRTVPIVLATAMAAASAPSAAYAVDPTATDCFAANEKSIALKTAGKLREARTQLALCQFHSCPADVRAVCDRRLDAVNAAIPTVIFDVKDAAGNDLAGVSLTMDGQPLANRLDGTVISLDPGEHKFVFTLAGQPPVEKTFVLKQTEKDRRERIVIGPAPGETVTPSPTTTRASPADALVPADTTTQTSSWNTQKTLAVASGVVGLAGIGVGTAFGLSASSKWSQAQADCGNGCGPADKAQTEKSDAETAATISSIGFAVGAAGLVGAAVLWFTAPKGSEPAAGATRLHLVPVVVAAGGACILTGAF